MSTAHNDEPNPGTGRALEARFRGERKADDFPANKESFEVGSTVKIRRSMEAKNS